MNTILNLKDTETLLDILVEQLGVTRAQLVPEARIKEDLGADSLTQIEIAMAMEETFGIAIPDDAWEQVSTVSDATETLARYRTCGPRE